MPPILTRLRPSIFILTLAWLLQQTELKPRSGSFRYAIIEN